MPADDKPRGVADRSMTKDRSVVADETTYIDTRRANADGDR